MRILLVSSEYPPRIGGIATHAAQLAGALAHLGHEVTVLAPGARETDGNPRVVRLRGPRFKPVYDWLLGRRIAALHRATPFDVIHVHGIRPLAAALAAGAPVVFTNHTSGLLKRVRDGRLRGIAPLFARLGFLIAPSEELLQAARAAGFAGEGEYIPNGVDANRFTPGSGEEMRSKWGLKPGEVAVLTARRLVPKNGVHTVALAAALLRETGCRFVFAGEGPERPRIRAAFEAAGLGDRALFLGGIPNEDMPPIYRGADICLLPSLMEATSIAGLEAMACARPLVGSRVGGIPAIIEDGATGILVDPGKAEPLAAAVRRLAGDGALRERMGRAARERVMREFSWEEVAKRTGRLLERASRRQSARLL
jgi:glycosyltransferase involved in cell wall biosynthesis